MSDEGLKDIDSNIINYPFTEHYYQRPVGDFSYTDGIKHLVEENNCLWLLDIIGNYQSTKEVTDMPVATQIWEVKVKQSRAAIVTMRWDDDNAPVAFKHEIQSADVPLDKIELWLFDTVLMLPSEYCVIEQIL